MSPNSANNGMANGNAGLDAVSAKEDLQGAIISLMPPASVLVNRTPVNSIVSGPILASGNIRVHLSQGDEARLHRALSMPSAAEIPIDADCRPTTSEATVPDRAGSTSGGASSAPSAVQGAAPTPSVVKGAPPSPSAAPDPNADRIKSLVKRFLKAPPAQPAAAQPATPPSTPSSPSAPSAPSKVGVSVAAAAPDSISVKKKKLRPLAADDGADGGLKHTQPAASPVAASIGGHGVTRRVAVSPAGSKELSLDAVLAKYDLPDEVATAVADAVVAKQLPSKPSSLDNLLARLLLPGSGLKPELVHAGGWYS